MNAETIPRRTSLATPIGALAAHEAAALTQVTLSENYVVRRNASVTVTPLAIACIWGCSTVSVAAALEEIIARAA